MRTEFYNHLEILKVLKTLYPKEREKQIFYLLDISDEYTKKKRNKKRREKQESNFE
jgi:hypothetical protein